MDLKELESVDPTSHWYYQSKLRALEHAATRFSASPKSLLDVGAGSGFFAEQLATRVGAGEVVCVDPNYGEAELGMRGNVRFVRDLSGVDSHQFDLVLFIDVLEHVVDDAALLRQYCGELRSGSLVLMTVPAFQSLWSGHDVFLEHVKRYRLAQLHDVASRAGLRILHEQYLFAALFPAAWVLRRLKRSTEPQSDLKTIGPVLNTVLRSYFTLEGRLRWNRVAGLTAFVVAEVP
jgi:2-polyprenyl-3-methyl-5-hydroxy-6-metoxy-1,4-benzoquinol methylase